MSHKWIAGVIAAAALGGAAQAQAKPLDCDARLERLEARFRVIEEQRGYDAAVKWWPKAWQRYYEKCEV